MQIKSRTAPPSEYLFQVSGSNNAELSKIQLDQYLTDLETDFNSYTTDCTYPRVFPNPLKKVSAIPHPRDPQKNRNLVRPKHKLRLPLPTHLLQETPETIP
jgi:hypothetical protein